MENIVVGVDESRASRSAVDWVAARCAAKPARVDVVNVVWDITGGRAASMEILAEAERAIRQRVPGQEVEFHRAEGTVARTLSDYSADADLLVIGVDPDRAVRAALGGWVPVRVAAHARVPVCVVPAGWVPADGAVTVGLADDGSSDRALGFAAREALETGAHLDIVHGWRLPDPLVDGTAAVFADPERVHDEHLDRLDAAVIRMRREYPALRVTSELVRATPADALLSRADASAMIVIGTHGQGVLAGGLSAAVGQDILWRARRPVCVVPPEPAYEREVA